MPVFQCDKILPVPEVSCVSLPDCASVSQPFCFQGSYYSEIGIYHYLNNRFYL